MWSICAKMNRTKKLDVDMMRTPLNRCLTTVDITLLGIGHMIGAGIYVLTGDVAKNVAGPAIVVSFIVAGITSLLAAICYAEFGARVPKAGSSYVYTYVTIGEFWAFVLGWNIMLEHMIGSAAVARAWSGYVDALFGGVIKNSTISTVGTIHADFFGHYPDFVACCLCIVLGALVAMGVKGSSYFNNAFTVINLLVVVFVICFGFYWADTRNWTNYNGFMPYGFKGVMAGAAAAFYAYVGFDSIATAGEEAKNPARSIPMATIIAMATVSAAYIGVSSALTLMVPYVDINPDASLPDAFAANGAYWAKYVVAIGALCGMTTTLFGGLFSLPRCVYAMASDGLFFQVFARVEERTQTPVINLLTCAFITGLIALLFDIDKLVEFMSIGTLMAYTIVSASVIILRYQPTHKFQNMEQPLEDIPKSSEDVATPQVGDGDVSGRLKPNLVFLEVLLDCEPGTAVTAATILMIIFMGASMATVHLAAPDVYNATWWSVLILMLFIGCTILCFLVICLHEQNKQPLAFKVPWVPLVPTLSVCFNIVLMTHLQWMTWVRFTVWMVLGILIYFTYGIRHSKENALVPLYSSLLVTNEAQKDTWGSMQETVVASSYQSAKIKDDKVPIVDQEE